LTIIGGVGRGAWRRCLAAAAEAIRHSTAPEKHAVVKT
jgi:hypothetical protein